MHFRVRKNVIQLIRVTYDGSTKKGSNAIIGSVRLSAPELSDELRVKLTEAEVRAFQVWLDTQHKTLMLKEEVAALTLAETLSLAERWFERGQGGDAAAMAAQDIVFQWQALRKVFLKKGLLE
ncbi:hypothetical protein [Methylovulum psychrotolerans]|jgi:hypothetical protein|uniref:Uncharacterized protein n=1 Tax=Methylovulum psychrotolerans TaxID=1704499 RepID=A0A1Z4C243_9GAMM|nr:hypothetical protein [Methylovulum psychrotolerans]ASF47602.1 hypothetical protein CEK71_16880 [Methylovulum psychrotolerans]MBT9099284.1 hypothetical protein [Methylovulum psychrotolerans]POZ51998.1 hypothetical protein AADEFJLK_02219 [Methylovulum psychrotolerans]